MTGSVHLRGIMIAGALAALALALGFVTLTMNQSASRATTHTVLTLKQRHLASAATVSSAKPAVKKAAAPKPDANLVAALQAGLPRSVARGLAAHRVVVVQLTSAGDSIAKLAADEAKTGAALAGASFVRVDVDKDGGDVEAMTRKLGALPMAPATLVYSRPATLYVTLDGFNDRTIVQQAAENAASPSSPTTTAPATASTSAPAATVPGAS